MSNKRERKKLVCTLSICFMLQASLCFAALTSQELQSFNKKLTAKEPRDVYAVTKEIYERGEKHPLLINGLRRYLKDDSIHFKMFIAETLVKIGDPYGIQYLDEMIKNDATSEYEKINALYSLGKTTNPDAIPVLQRYTTAHDDRLKTAAHVGLLQCGVIYSAEEIIAIYDGLSKSNKVSLLNALSSHDGKYIPVYSIALEDKAGTVAYSAFKYLVMLEDFGGIDTIYTKLSQIKHQKTRHEAELLLAEKNMIEDVSWIKEYANENLYGRSLVLESIMSMQDIYPVTTDKILVQLTAIEQDPYLQQKIEALQEKIEEDKTSGTK